MEHGFRGCPRVRGQSGIPPRGNHLPQPHLIPAGRIMNTNVNAWQPNSVPHHFPQSPDEGMNYQQPLGDGFHAPAYPQYPPTMPTPEGFSSYPTAQMYAAQLYHSPAPIETQQQVYPLQVSSKNSRGMQLSRDGIITCANCRHRNALAESEFIKKDEEIAQLRMELKLLRAKEAEEQLQRRIPQQSQEAAAEGSPSPEMISVSSKSLLSPNAVEFNPVPQRTASNDSAAEVPVVSAKGVSDDAEAEEAMCCEASVEESAVQCEQERVQISQVQVHEDFQALAKDGEEEWEAEAIDLEPVQLKSEPQGPEQTPAETTEDIKPVVETDECCKESQQQNINTNTKAFNAWDNRGDRNNQRHSSRWGSDANPYGGYSRGKSNRGRDQDHYNNDRNFPRNNRGNHNQNRTQNYRANNHRNNDDGGCDNRRGSSQDRQRSDGQRDTDSPQSQRKDLGNQGSTGRRWENVSRGNDNRYHRNETNKDGNRGQSDAEGFQAQLPRGRGGRFSEDNTAKYHYKSKPQENTRESGGSWSGKGGSSVKDVVMEFSGDLFSAPTDFSLAHCVARDFRMGSGIAVKFRSEFKRVAELLDQDVGVGGCAHLTDKDRFIFYLVTKELSSCKPTYDSLRASLRELRNKCQLLSVKKLAMPRIGCGLDRLDWLKVKHMVNEIFQDCDMEVHAYEFNVEGVSEAEGNRPEARSGTHVKYEKMNLSVIAKQTGLLFLGTEDGFMDSVATSLDARFKFLTFYKKSQKNVGKVWRHVMPDYYIYAIIVAKTYSNNKVPFSVLDECFRSLAKMVRQDEFQYIGLEVSKDWNCEDTLFTEKMTVLLRYMLPRCVRQLWVCFPDENLDPNGLCVKYASKQPQNLPS